MGGLFRLSFKIAHFFNHVQKVKNCVKLSLSMCHIELVDVSH